jgi:arginyl-tRNA--protein-N-Asp/Glu arginylyltransferase
MIFDIIEPLLFSPQDYDKYWASGWDRDAEHLFRQETTILHGEVHTVVPLRIVLQNYQHSKSQRKILQKNRQIKAVFSPLNITPELEQIYQIHKQKFHGNVRENLIDFFIRIKDENEFPTTQLCLYDEEKLIAASFFDEGKEAIYSIFGTYLPEYASQSLGILTMLLEIEYAIKTNRKYYYPGHAVDNPSIYDYKLKFNALQYFDWKNNWKNIQYLPQEETAIRRIKKQLTAIQLLLHHILGIETALYANKDFYYIVWTGIKDKRVINSPLYLTANYHHTPYFIEYNVDNDEFSVIMGYYQKILYKGSHTLVAAITLKETIFLQEERFKECKSKLEMLSKLLPIGLLYPQNKKFIVKTENIISEKIEHPLAVIYSWISPDGKKKWDFYIEYRVDKKIWRFYNQIVDFQKNKHQVIFPLEDNIQTTADQIFDFVWKKISKI